MPIGKNKAPATKKPHIACEKQVKMCVSHAAMHMRTMIVGIGLSIKASLVLIFCLPEIEQGLEHRPTTISVLG